MLYKDMYNNIDQAVIDKTRALFVTENKFYRVDDEKKFTIMKEWLAFVSEHYHVNCPTLKVDFNAQHDGFYRHADNYIELPKFSVVTLLHEFKHAMDIMKDGRTTEERARGWSMSLFARFSPKLYEQAVSKGIVFWVEVGQTGRYKPPEQTSPTPSIGAIITPTPAGE
jgi:hypothetical protein